MRTGVDRETIIKAVNTEVLSFQDRYPDYEFGYHAIELVDRPDVANWRAQGLRFPPGKIGQEFVTAMHAVQRRLPIMRAED